MNEKMYGPESFRQFFEPATEDGGPVLTDGSPGSPLWRIVEYHVIGWMSSRRLSKWWFVSFSYARTMGWFAGYRSAHCMAIAGLLGLDDDHLDRWLVTARDSGRATFDDLPVLVGELMVWAASRPSRDQILAALGFPVDEGARS
jgi:hypothetical protein